MFFHTLSVELLLAVRSILSVHFHCLCVTVSGSPFCFIFCDSSVIGIKIFQSGLLVTEFTVLTQVKLFWVFSFHFLRLYLLPVYLQTNQVLLGNGPEMEMVC